jgi:hypothetical protein
MSKRQALGYALGSLIAIVLGWCTLQLFVEIVIRFAPH